VFVSRAVLTGSLNPSHVSRSFLSIVPSPRPITFAGMPPTPNYQASQTSAQWASHTLAHFEVRDDLSRCRVSEREQEMIFIIREALKFHSSNGDLAESTRRGLHPGFIHSTDLRHRHRAITEKLLFILASKHSNLLVIFILIDDIIGEV